MKKIILSTIIVLVLVGGAIVASQWNRIQRAQYVTSLFTGVEQYENFANVKNMFPVAEMKPSTQPYQFPEGALITLPASFRYEGKELNTQEFLKTTDTGALLVLKDGKLVHEKYTLTGGRPVQWLSMSVAKSFISAALGIALEEGHIKSIDQTITDYLPNLKGSAYDAVTIKDVLQMSSGAAWDEDYSNPESEVLKMGRIMALGGSLDEFLASTTREKKPGTYNRYNSADTQVLGALLVKATGRSIRDYMQEKIWTPLGMESSGYWIIDNQGMEMAFAGLNATARDYLKMGELFRNNGNWQGKQIIPSEWVKASVTPDAPHLQAGANPNSDNDMGYGYQWWVMEGDEGEFSAIGVYNQFIYVNPAKNLVIVKLSANSDYGTDNNSEAANKEMATIELFRAIGNELQGAPGS